MEYIHQKSKGSRGQPAVRWSYRGDKTSGGVLCSLSYWGLYCPVNGSTSAPV